MSDGENILAWLEQTSGARVPIVGNCSIGRSSSNTITLTEERVSRRHALINMQGLQEYWLVDLGSGNGTSLNVMQSLFGSRFPRGRDWVHSLHQSDLAEAELKPADLDLVAITQARRLDHAASSGIGKLEIQI